MNLPQLTTKHARCRCDVTTEFARVLSQGIEDLFKLCDDDNCNVRIAADMALNRVIKIVSGSVIFEMGGAYLKWVGLI